MASGCSTSATSTARTFDDEVATVVGPDPEQAARAAAATPIPALHRTIRCYRAASRATALGWRERDRRSSDDRQREGSMERRGGAVRLVGSRRRGSLPGRAT